MATYSLAITGAPADSVPLAQVVTLPDDSARAGNQQAAAQTGAPMLCRRRDGSSAYYVLDAERSTSAVPVLRLL